MSLNLIAPINNVSYGIVSKNIIYNLHCLDEISLFPIQNPDIEQYDVERGLGQKLKQLIDNTSSYDNNGDSLTIWHQFDLARRIGKGKHCAFSFFEVDVLTERERHHINQLDLFFVASKWAQSIVCEQTKHTPQTCIVAPLGVNREIFNEFKTVQNDKDKLIIATVGKWERRKGHDLLVDVFNSAFTEHDNVELHMFTFSPFNNEEQNKYWQSLYLNSKLGNKIKLFPRIKDQQELAQLLQPVDVGIFLSRAEGWNLPALEMMAMNKPIIITNYSAHTEFCNENNSWLIPINEKEPAIDGIWFKGEGNWADLGENEFEYAVSWLRHAYGIKQKNNLLTNQNGIETSKQFNWKNTTDIIMEAILA
jgi:glycosyltransferase involved in cell wall biosynthesis